MSAHPLGADDALPVITAREAHQQGLCTARQIAFLYEVEVRSMRARLDGPGAPPPVALTRSTRDALDPLYRLREVRDHFAGVSIGGRVRSEPPRRIGTRTRARAGEPSAPYRWRDPARIARHLDG